MLYLVLDNIRSSWNVGSGFRTADALGAQLILVGYTSKPVGKNYDLIKKTAIGAQDWVPWQHFEHWQEVLAVKPGIHIGLEITETSQDIFEFLDTFEGFAGADIYLWFGNEIHGLNQDLCQNLTHTVHLPMLGKKESINVSSTMAAAGYLMLGRVSSEIS